MAARLGNVLYWTGCGIAAASLIGAVVGVFYVPPEARLAVVLGCAIVGAVIYLIGLAARYVLGRGDG